jgi:hypothetical protein
MEKNSAGGRRGALFKGTGGGRNQRGVRRHDRRVEEAAQAREVPVDRRAAPGRQRPEPGGRTGGQHASARGRGGIGAPTGGTPAQCRSVVKTGSSLFK